MPRNQGNNVASAAALGDGFDLAAALRVRLVPLVVMAEAPGIGYGNADCRIHFWCTLKGTTALETWLAKCHLIVPVDPAVNLAEAFRHQARPQGPPRLHHHPRRRPVRVAFHPDR